MTGLLAYARALSIPGGGRRRLWLEGFALLGAGIAFADAGLPPMLQAFGGAVMAHTAAAGAGSGVAGAARHPSALPTLPITPGARIGALLLLSAPRMLPAAAVALAVGVAPGEVAGRIVAGIGLLATFQGSQRVIGTLSGPPRRAAMFLLLVPAILSIATDAPLAAALAGVLTMGLVAALDARPGLADPAPHFRYRPHPLDAAPATRPLFRSAQRDAARLGFRDGLLAGTALLILIATHTMILGSHPAGDLEEVAAAARWGLREWVLWPAAFQILGFGSITVLARSVVLPGHSTDPVARASALAALRWLPISRADVWHGSAAVALTSLGAAWTGAMLPLGLGIFWAGGSGVATVVLLALTSLACGLAAGLVYLLLGPLRAYEGGDQAPGQAAFMVPTVLLAAPTLAFLFVHIVDILRSRAGGAFEARAVLLGAAILLLVTIAGRYRRLARA